MMIEYLASSKEHATGFYIDSLQGGSFSGGVAPATASTDPLNVRLTAMLNTT